MILSSVTTDLFKNSWMRQQNTRKIVPFTFVPEYFATVADGIGDTGAVDDKVLATHPSVQNIMQNMTGYQGFHF